MAKKILIVEDELPMIRLLEYNLARAGYEVLVANNGSDAIEKIKQEKPDLVLTDIMMPQMDGYELCRRVHKEVNTRSIPFIFVTAKVNMDRVENSKLGVTDYIVKPFDPDALLAKIETVLK